MDSKWEDAIYRTITQRYANRLSVVIKPVQYYIGAHKWYYDGKTHTINGHPFDQKIFVDSDMDKYAQYPSAIEYWQAQCIFRGLEPTDKVHTMKQLLRVHEREGVESRVQNRLLELEVDYDDKKAIVERRIKDEIWPTCRCDEEKIILDKDRFLTEYFPVGDTDQTALDKTLVLRMRHYPTWTLQTKLRLKSERVDVVDYVPGSGNKVLYRSCLVFGRSVDAIKARRIQIEQEARAKWRAMLDDRLRIDHCQNRAVLEEAEESGDLRWLILGGWTIRCPQMETSMDPPPWHLDRPIAMKLSPLDWSEGERMSFELHFTKSTKKGQLLRTWELYREHEDPNWRDDIDDGMPSPAFPKWAIIWEQDLMVEENEFPDLVEQKSGTITFGDPYGTTLTGSIHIEGVAYQITGLRTDQEIKTR